MKPFFQLLLGIIGGGVFALGRASVVLANGGHVHFGTVAIPVVAVWVGGGVLGAFFLFFFIGWGLSLRARGRSQEEKERSPETTKDEKR